MSDATGLWDPHRPGRGHTPPGECRRQTPRHLPQGGNTENPMPGAEGRCTGRPGSSAV